MKEKKYISVIYYAARTRCFERLETDFTDRTVACVFIMSNVRQSVSENTSLVNLRPENTCMRPACNERSLCAEVCVCVWCELVCVCAEVSPSVCSKCGLSVRCVSRQVNVCL